MLRALALPLPPRQIHHTTLYMPPNYRKTYTECGSVRYSTTTLHNHALRLKLAGVSERMPCHAYVLLVHLYFIITDYEPLLFFPSVCMRISIDLRCCAMAGWAGYTDSRSSIRTHIYLFIRSHSHTHTQTQIRYGESDIHLECRKKKIYRSLIYIQELRVWGYVYIKEAIAIAIADMKNLLDSIRLATASIFVFGPQHANVLIFVFIQKSRR